MRADRHESRREAGRFACTRIPSAESWCPFAHWRLVLRRSPPMSRSPRKAAAVPASAHSGTAAAEQHAAAGVSTAAAPVAPLEPAAGHKSPRKLTQTRAPATAAASGESSNPAAAVCSASAAASGDTSRPIHHSVWSFGAKAPISQQMLPSATRSIASASTPAPESHSSAGHSSSIGSEEKQEDEVAPEQLASQPSTVDPSADECAGGALAATAADDTEEPAELRSWHDEIPEEAFDQLTVEAEARALLGQTTAIEDSPTEYEDTFDAPPPEDQKQLPQHRSRKDKQKSNSSVDASSASTRSPPAKPKQKSQPHPPPTATVTATAGPSTPVRPAPRTPLSARQSSSSTPSSKLKGVGSAADLSPPRTARAVQSLPSIAAALDSAASDSASAGAPSDSPEAIVNGGLLLPSTSILHPVLPVVASKPPSTAGSVGSSVAVISQLHSSLTAAQLATQSSQNALSAKNLRIRSLQRENEALGCELDKCKQQLQAERDKRQMLQRNSSVNSLASGAGGGGSGAGSLSSTLTLQAQVQQNRQRHRHAKRSRALEDDLAASKLEVNKLSVALDTARRRLRIKLGREAPPALLRALRQARAEASELKLQLSNSLASHASFEQLMDLQHTVDEQNALIDQLHSQLRAMGARVDDDEVEVQMLPATSQMIRAHVVEGSVALSPPRSAAPKDPLADDDDVREDDPPQMQRPQQTRAAEQKAAWGAQQAAGNNPPRSQPKSLSPSAAQASSSPSAASPVAAPAVPATATDAPASPALGATVAALRNDLAIQRALVSQYASRQVVHDRLTKQQYAQLVSLTREYHSRGEIIHQLNARVKELMEDREWQAQERKHGVEPSVEGATPTPMTPQSHSSPTAVESPILQASKAAIIPPPIIPPSSFAPSASLMHPPLRRIEEAAAPGPVVVSPVQAKSPQSAHSLPTQASTHGQSSAVHVFPSQLHPHPPPQAHQSSPQPRSAVPALQLPTISQTMAQHSSPSASTSSLSAPTSATPSPQRVAPSFTAAFPGSAMNSSSSPRSPPPAFSVTPALAALTPVLMQQRQQQMPQHPLPGYGQRAWPQGGSPLSSPLPISKVARSRQHMAAALSAYSGSQSHR